MSDYTTHYGLALQDFANIRKGEWFRCYRERFTIHTSNGNIQHVEFGGFFIVGDGNEHIMLDENWAIIDPVLNPNTAAETLFRVDNTHKEKACTASLFWLLGVMTDGDYDCEHNFEHGFVAWNRGYLLYDGKIVGIFKKHSIDAQRQYSYHILNVMMDEVTEAIRSKIFEYLNSNTRNIVPLDDPSEQHVWKEFLVGTIHEKGIE